MSRVTGEWLTQSATQRIFALLTQAGFQAYVVGGSVRNALMGVDVADIDFATDARPADVQRLAESAAIKNVPTGIEHGTITLVLEGKAFEVTTYRKDVETDGRRAVVAYANTLLEDADRRDFRMNAIYADADGEIHDPLGGIKDIQKKRVVFVGDAETRIKEDVLRILRFFRFHAWYGDPAVGLDPDGLAACSAYSAEIETLSRERIGAEMLRLLAAPNPAPAVAAMMHSGVLAAALPGADDRAMAVLVHLEGQISVDPDPIRRLAGIGGEDCANRLRLSKQQARRLDTLNAEVAALKSPGELGYRHGSGLATDILLLRSALMEREIEASMIEAANIGAKAVFPVKASDLMPELEGVELGERLKELEAMWIATDFIMDRDALLS